MAEYTSPYKELGINSRARPAKKTTRDKDQYATVREVRKNNGKLIKRNCRGCPHNPCSNNRWFSCKWRSLDSKPIRIINNQTP